MYHNYNQDPPPKKKNKKNPVLFTKAPILRMQEKAKQFYEAQRFKLWKRRPLDNLPGASDSRDRLLGRARCPKIRQISRPKPILGFRGDRV